MTPEELAALRKDLAQESLATDSLAEHLEYRVAAIEEVIAARWPRRIVVRFRLARQLRVSLRFFPGATFEERRTAAATADWLDQ